MLPCSITGYLCMHKHAADARQPDLACHSCWHGIQADSAMAGLSWGNSVQPFGFLPQHGFNADSGPFRWQNASGSWCQGMSRSLFMQCIANLSAHASGKRFEIMGNTWCYKAWLVMVHRLFISIVSGVRAISLAIYATRLNGDQSSTAERRQA